MIGGRGSILVAALSAALASSPAPADVVWFARGGHAEARVDVRGDRVRLTTPGGTFDFRREDIRRIVPLPAPEDEWPTRAAEARAGGAQSRFEAAWWALGHGLTPQAVALLREALAADPAHQPTARMVAALDLLDAPRPDPDLVPVRRALHGRFEEARGPHVLLLHQSDPVEAAGRIDLLERVTTTYALVLTAWGIDLPVIARRLPFAHFAGQGDYLDFLRRQGAGAFLTTRGYYHPTLRLVATYDARLGESMRPAREAIDRARPAPGLLESDRQRREVGRQELLFDLECRAIDVATASHEMIHQLVDATGLCPRPDAFPVWLHEGFAAQFEVVHGGRWAGVGRPNDFRLPYFRKLSPPPRLAPLVRDTGFGHGYHPDLYAEAWGLVYYLRKEHPREFVAFLDLLRAPGPDESPDRVFSAFRAAFGDDLGVLESSWHRAMGGVKTPLEEASGVSSRFSAARLP